MNWNNIMKLRISIAEGWGHQQLKVSKHKIITMKCKPLDNPIFSQQIGTTNKTIIQMICIQSNSRISSKIISHFMIEQIPII